MTCPGFIDTKNTTRVWIVQIAFVLRGRAGYGTAFLCLFLAGAAGSAPIEPDATGRNQAALGPEHCTTHPLLQGK